MNLLSRFAGETTDGAGSKGRSFLYLVLLGLFYLPVFSVLSQAFLRRNAWTEILALLGSEQMLKVLSFSTKQALLSAFFSLLLALPGAYFFGRYDFPGKRLLRSMMIIPFMLPGILVVLGMVVFYGRNGAFNQFLAHLFSGEKVSFTGLYGFKGIVLTHVFYNFSFCLRMLGERWERLSPRLEEASLMLGAPKMETWVRVTLPLLLPTISYLFTLVFLYSFLSFTVVLVLGGYLYQTFEVLIYIEYNHKLNFDRAGLLAGMQLIFLAVVLTLQNWTGRIARRQTGELSFLPSLSLKQHGRRAVIFLIYLILAMLFFILPLLLVLIRSCQHRGQAAGAWTLENYRLLFGEEFRFAVGQQLGTVLVTSLALAVAVAVVTVVLADLVAKQRRKYRWDRYDLWLQLPMGVSFLTFAFGLINLTGRALPSWVLIIWAQVFLAFPLVYSILRTARRELGEELLEAAELLGASGRELFRTIEFPLLKPALGSALAYGAALSLGDLSAVLVLGQGKLATLSIAVYRLIGHYHFPLATALGTVFILLSLLLFSLVEGGRFGGGE